MPDLPEQSVNWWLVGAGAAIVLLGLGPLRWLRGRWKREIDEAKARVQESLDEMEALRDEPH